MKTKEQIRKYNKEYSARPEVKERARIKNARPESRAVRKAYKQTDASKKANIKYRQKESTKLLIKNRHLKKLYGISIGEYELMYTQQGGCCAICATHYNLLHVDHCHTTNKVRGLLCGNCNRAIGLFKDKIKNLEKAIKYLDV